MLLSVHPNKLHTVDAVHKLGSYPIPRKGRNVASMDKITAQELDGAIVLESAQTPGHPRNKYLGFILDRIFSDFDAFDIPEPDTLMVPLSTISKYNCSLAEAYPTAHEIPLYNSSTEQWNWPLKPLPNTKGGVSQEKHLASFFNAIARAIRPALTAQSSSSDPPKPPIAKRCWLGSFSTHRMPGNPDGAGAFHRKPDLILIDTSDVVVDSLSWMSPKVIAEYTSQAWKPSLPITKTLHTKAYLTFLDQPWRRFVLGLSIAKEDIRVHFFNRSGISVSPPFNIHRNPRAFISILATVMFGSRLCIGFDPTITVKPVQPLRFSERKVIHHSSRADIPAAILEELEEENASISPSIFATPELVEEDPSISSSTSTSAAHFNHADVAPDTPDTLLADSAPDYPGFLDIPGPIGEIWIRDVVYEIMEILFSSSGFLGRGTVIYLARREGKMYIIKDHWVENPMQEATTMKIMQGTPGVPNLVDHWVVEIPPGRPDVTSWYRSDVDQAFMKGVRTHARTAMTPRGRPLTKFRSKREFVKCIRDVLVSVYIFLSCEDA